MSARWNGVGGALILAALVVAARSDAQPSPIPGERQTPPSGTYGCHDKKVDRGVEVECDAGMCQFLPDRAGRGHVCATLKVSWAGEASPEVVKNCSQLDSAQPRSEFFRVTGAEAGPKCQRVQIEELTFEDASGGSPWIPRLARMVAYLVPLFSALFVVLDTRRRRLPNRTFWILCVLFAWPVAFPWYLVKRPPQT